MSRAATTDVRGRALAAAEALLAETPGGRRLALTTLEERVSVAAPEVPPGRPRHELLADVISEYVDAGRVVLPRTARAWMSGRPPLPRWMAVSTERNQEPARRPRRHPWHPALAWASRLALSDGQFEALTDVQAWLVARDGNDPHAYVRERSVDVFGDDKRLESLLGGPLFAPGRLSLELLDCEVAFPPLAAAELPQGGDWLVVENGTTFRRLARTPSAIPHVRLLIYGAGGQAAAGLPALLAEHPAPDRVSWFGDIDRDGLRFAVSASATLAAEGLDVRPHLPLYRQLVAVGRTAASRAAPLTERQAHELGGWLEEPPLRDFAVKVLTAGLRAPQEQVGPRHLGAPVDAGQRGT